MFLWTFLLRITHTIISQSRADSSWITLYIVCIWRCDTENKCSLLRSLKWNFRNHDSHLHFARHSSEVQETLILSTKDKSVLRGGCRASRILQGCWQVLSPTRLKKTIERSPFFVRRGGHCCCGDLVGQITFWMFLSGLQKLEFRRCSLFPSSSD